MQFRDAPSGAPFFQRIVQSAEKRGSVQKRRHSLLEACVGTIVGLAVAVAANWIVLPLFGFPVSLSQSFWIAVVFTTISVARSYAVRRLFNWLHTKGVL